MSYQDRARIITALFFSGLPYKRKFLHFVKEKNLEIFVSEEPWDSNKKLLKYFFSSSIIEYTKQKVQNYYKKQLFYFDFCILWGEPSYPQLLKEIYDPPLVLFCRSTFKKEIDLNQFDTISIVGTRKPLTISLQAVDRIIELFSISKSSENFIHNLGVVNQNNKGLFGSIVSNPFEQNLLETKQIATVSGFAKGIDFRVHKASLFFEVPTIAIIGSGIDRISPKSSYPLFNEALQSKQQFILISEFFPTFKAGKYTFPLRNRIIVGMSPYLFLVQAGKKSGALISVDYALQENREVIVFHHNLFSQIGGNEGGLELIQQGANQVTFPI